MAEQKLTEAERDAILREHLFTPIESKEHLRTWVLAFLGLDLPGTTVCGTDTDHEPSNSNPLDLLWEVYQAARTGDKKKAFLLYYAARGCYKSLLASVMECLCLFQLRRDVGHAAANKKQSHIVQDYLAQYLKRPVLRDFMTSKNRSEIGVTWYEHDGVQLTPAEYQAAVDKNPESVREFVEKTFQVTVVVATLGGANGLHVSFMVLDELDLTPENVISEAMMIPAPGKEAGEHPMILMTSSRKFATGPVQNAIDNAHRTGCQIRHWNVIDVTKACPPERHRPDLPRLPVYYCDETLTTVTEAEYKAYGEEEQAKWKRDEAYAGCVSNCKIFAMCRGRLATEQKSETSLLRDIDFTQQLFATMVDVEKAQAQLLCWKPSRAGLVYPRLSRDRHMLTPAQVVAMMTGEDSSWVKGKSDLLRFLATQDVSYGVGIDHGFNHCFAGVLGVRWANTMIIIDAFEIPGLETDGKVKVMVSRYKDFAPSVWADTSHPGDNKTIARHGFKVKSWVKGPGSVVDGIGVVRMKLNPVLMKRPELFFLAGDPGVEALFERLDRYKWVIDVNTGEPTDVPDEKDDDVCDALRYLVMNVFAPGGRGIKVAQDALQGPTDPRAGGDPLPMPAYLRPGGQQPLNQREVAKENWRRLMEHSAPAGVEAPPGQARGKKGRFFWDME